MKISLEFDSSEFAIANVFALFIQETIQLIKCQNSLEILQEFIQYIKNKKGLFQEGQDSRTSTVQNPVLQNAAQQQSSARNRTALNNQRPKIQNNSLVFEISSFDLQVSQESFQKPEVANIKNRKSTGQNQPISSNIDDDKLLKLQNLYLHRNLQHSQRPQNQVQSSQSMQVQGEEKQQKHQQYQIKYSSQQQQQQQQQQYLRKTKELQTQPSIYKPVQEEQQQEQVLQQQLQQEQQKQYIKDWGAALKQNRQKHSISNMIEKLVNENTAETALKELQDKFLPCSASKKSETINKFIKKLIQFLTDENISDQQCEDSLSFMEKSQKSGNFPDFRRNGQFFRYFNDQLRDQIKQSVGDARKMSRLSLVRALGIDFGVFDFCEVVQEILEDFLRIESGFEFFQGGLDQLAKFFMVGLDGQFRVTNLDVAVRHALKSQDFSQFAKHERYEDFMELLEHTRQHMEVEL